MKTWSSLADAFLLASYISDCNLNGLISYGCFAYYLVVVVLNYFIAVNEVGSFTMISPVKCLHGK